MNSTIPRDLLERVRNGGEKDFEELVFLTERRIFSYIITTVQHRQTAEDLTQEVFLRLFKNIRSLDPDKGFKTWLFTIATNVVYDWFRKQKRLHEAFSIDNEEHPFETIDEAQSYESIETAEDIAKALQAIKPVHRQVLILFYYQGLTYEEIGGVMGLSLNTIKTTIRRAKQSLRDRLEKNSYGAS